MHTDYFSLDLNLPCSYASTEPIFFDKQDLLFQRICNDLILSFFFLVMFGLVLCISSCHPCVINSPACLLIRHTGLGSIR
jgi:hypothetical protein